MRRLMNVFGKVSSLAILGLAGSAFGGYWLVRYLRPRYSPLVLNGAVVIVTGASSGIGRAYAEAFARRGAKVVLVARRTELLEEVRREIEPYAAAVLAIPADLTDDAARAEVVRRTLESFGKISILINNAGVTLGGPLETYTTDQIANMVNINLTASIALTRHALPAMLTRGRGIVVNVASAAGRIAGIGYSAYTGTKAGLLGFSDGLRRELFGTGVQVISVLPGYTRTEMVNNAAFIHHIQQQGIQIFEAMDVAEATIKGIYNGQNEVFITGFVLRTLAYLDRRYPNLTSVILQATNSPQAIDLIQHQSDPKPR